ncbi:hypothetical protein HP532_27715 [Pseudomonas sp. CrR25]|nr:hypothetical protein [Pseudomonas sp. CrR25]
MRMLGVLLAGLIALGGAASARDYRLPLPADRPAGAPGMATPQPFTQPQPRNLPSTAPNNPPLLNDGSGNQGGRLRAPSGSLAPSDEGVPLLQQQLRRNSQGLPSDGRDAD